MFQTNCRENQTHVSCSNFFFSSENRTVYDEAVRKNMVEPDAPQMSLQYGARKMRFVYRTTMESRHIPIIFNTYCFYAATMLTRASFNVNVMGWLYCMFCCNRRG
jgi:hypothetical protein